MGDSAEVQILLQWKQESEGVVREVQASLAAIAAQASITNLILRSFAGAMADGATQTQAATAAAAGGLPAWVGMAAAIGGVAVILYPLALLIASAAIALTSFAVAGAGFIAIGALVAGVFAAIGAGVLFLGGGGGVGAAAALTTTTTALTNAKEALQEFDWVYTGVLTKLQQTQREQLVENIAKAQDAYNAALLRSQGPVGVLLNQFSQMRDTLAQQAQPLAALITQWVGGAVPGVTLLGQTIMTWFGERLPGVLSGMSKVIKDLAPDFNAFGAYFGGVMDKIGPMLAPITEAFIRLGLQGAKGLLDNLVRLSDWFVKELPTLGPIVGQIFGKIGDFVQWVASNWATLNDFAANKWPTTVKNAQEDLKKLSDWRDKNSGTITTFIGHVIDLMGAVNNLIGAWTWLMTLFDNLGIGPTRVLGAFNAIGDSLQRIVSLTYALGGHPGNLSLTTGQGGSAPAGGRAGGNIFPAAGGFEGTVTQPTLFLAGEAGPEGVSIRPKGKGGGGGGDIYVTVMGSVQTERGLALTLRETIRRLDREQR